MLIFIRRNVHFILQGPADFVQSVQQTVFLKIADVKGVSGAIRTDDRLLLQVYHQLVSLGGVCLLSERCNNVCRQSNRKNAVLVAIVAENIGKRGRENRLETVLLKCPRGMLSRTTASEIHACDEDTRTGVAWEIQYEFWVRIATLKVAPVVKEKFTEAGSFDPFQELLWDNLVGVNINPVEWDNASHVFFECFHFLNYLPPIRLTLMRMKNKLSNQRAMNCPTTSRTVRSSAIYRTFRDYLIKFLNLTQANLVYDEFDPTL